MADHSGLSFFKIVYDTPAPKNWDGLTQELKDEWTRWASDFADNRVAKHKLGHLAMVTIPAEEDGVSVIAVMQTLQYWTWMVDYLVMNPPPSAYKIIAGM